jgi:flagellar hook protein FlgE
VYYQTIQGAGAPTAIQGGTNANQIGYGAQIGTIDVLHTTAGSTTTNRTMDQYIDGDGYFVVQQPDGSFTYSKLGNLYFDTEGNLVDTNGNYVCGADGTNFTTGGTPEMITVSTADGDAYDLSGYSSISVSTTGVISGVNSTGTIDTLGQLALAYFTNQDGLTKTGNGYYTASANSGTAVYYAPGETTVGSLVSGALESSNVDLSKEFTDMIKAQRGYQANARVINTSDEILQELVNLKR